MNAEAHCKACNKPMTEGRAYELGSHRWHVGCFRCSTCNDQLTAHTNMLVLGDGTLVCANCSYECAVCSKKIKDMAVLTNDQAFCASCFVCRNCKKRIDDLQYARTSQGIFCMVCHTALLARKRQLQQLKKQQQQQGLGSAATKPAAHAGGSPQVSESGAGSSKSSLASANSLRRDKDLPELPQDPPLPQDDDPNAKPRDQRRLRVPRKQLAPSAFTDSTPNVASSSGSDLRADLSPEDSSASEPPTGSSSHRSGLLADPFDTKFESRLDPLNAEPLASGRALSASSKPQSPQVPASSKPQSPQVPASQYAVPPQYQIPASQYTGSTSQYSGLASQYSGSTSQYSSSQYSGLASNHQGSTSNHQGSTSNHHGSTQPHGSGAQYPSSTTPDPILSTPPRSRSKVGDALTPEGRIKAVGPTSTAPGGTTTPAMGSPAASLTSSATSASIAASLNGGAAAALSPDGMSVPRRSQLRPVSPARSWAERSPHHPPTQPSLPSSHSTQFPTTASPKPPAPVPVPVDKPPRSATSSPTQAAAPQGTPKSPFNRWWHKQTDSISSTKSSGSTYIPVTLSHKRSLSENTAGGSRPVSSGIIEDTTGKAGNAPQMTLSEALAALSLEQQRTKNAELRVQEWENHHSAVQKRGALRAELAQLEQQIDKMRDEHKLLTSRNKQLKEMNAELERQTLEKFGPNSLWGSQNPPLDSSVSSPSTSSKDTGFGGGSAQLGGAGQGEAPLVTRLDDPQIESSAPSQAQFLPLKSAKQWLFRRPNRPVGSTSAANNSSAGSMGAPGSSRNLPPGLKPYNQSNGSGSNPALSGGGPGSGYGGHPGGANGASHANGSAAGARPSLLGESLEYRTQIDHAPVPYFVTRCFAEIESRGLDTEGIYRKPGSKSQIDAILEQFGPNGDAKLGEELLGGEIQAVSSAVKQYLRALAEPVIAYDCYEAFVAAGNSRNPEVLRRAVHALPPAHLATLKAVVSHLTLVASHESNNLMNVRNLAMVFAPTLARDESGDREIPDMQARNEATQMLIVYSNIVLEQPDELL